MHTNTSLHKSTRWQNRQSERYLSPFCASEVMAIDDCMTFIRLFSSRWGDWWCGLSAFRSFDFFTCHLKRASVLSCFGDADAKSLYLETLKSCLISAVHKQSQHTRQRHVTEEEILFPLFGCTKWLIRGHSRISKSFSWVRVIANISTD